MAGWDDLDDDPPVLDSLHGLIAGVDGELLADRLLDRDLDDRQSSVKPNERVRPAGLQPTA